MSKDPQMQITDETLMALADKQLPADRADRVRAAVNADPALQERLHLFTETRRVLQQEATASSTRATDDALIARIRQATGAQHTAPVPPVPANENRRPLTALAAGLAAAVIGLGWWWQAGGPGMDLPSDHLAALTSLPSGETGNLGNGQELTMIASYRARTGELCREYETRAGTDMSIRIACRTESGWQARYAETITASDGYVPASGEIASLDAFLADAGLGAPLTPEEERKALE
ncbi:MAG: hypothetical protein COB97_10530 [Paracoccus sp.]|nr:MAG: hypothetical protein COB97_10530 [Paracoccus sp. (in: a-proteobacteria)]